VWCGFSNSSQPDQRRSVKAAACTFSTASCKADMLPTSKAQSQTNFTGSAVQRRAKAQCVNVTIGPGGQLTSTWQSNAVHSAPATSVPGCISEVTFNPCFPENHRLKINITGLHPTSSKGNVITGIDHFTKWVELFPMRNQEAPTVAKLLFEGVICRHGCPTQILTDQGPNFESHLFQELNRLLSIDKIRTTPYKPSTNGNIERFHGTMHSMLAKLVSDNQRDWDQKLPAVAFTYRTTVQETTRFTP